MADFYFSMVSIKPNPTYTDSEYLISVAMPDKDIVLEDGNGAVIIDSFDNKAILASLKYQVALVDNDGVALADADGIALAIRKES